MQTPHSPRSHPSLVAGEAEPLAQDVQQRPAGLHEQTVGAPVHVEGHAHHLDAVGDRPGRRLELPTWAIVAAATAPVPTVAMKPRRLTPVALDGSSGSSAMANLVFETVTTGATGERDWMGTAGDYSSSRLALPRVFP